MITIPLAALSYYVVETPLMRFKYTSVREAVKRAGWITSRRGVSIR